MRKSRFAILFAALLLTGAGCLSAPAPEPLPPQDATPHVNETNCVKSGGTVNGDNCDCPDGYLPDPAGFCLDAQGKPGGDMAPKAP